MASTQRRSASRSADVFRSSQAVDFVKVSFSWRERSGRGGLHTGFGVLGEFLGTPVFDAHAVEGCCCCDEIIFFKADEAGTNFPLCFFCMLAGCWRRLLMHETFDDGLFGRRYGQCG